MAQIEELYIDQNSSFEYLVEIDNPTGGNFDLTSYPAKAQLRRSYKTTSKVDFAVSYLGDPSLGQIKVALTPAQTGALKHGSYVWDIIIEGAGGDAYRVVEGIAYVEPGVTALS